jgi:DNA-binding transcriptional ArsR family regulator
MSSHRSSGTSALERARAPVFAALGHRTRLALVHRLSSGRPCSITKLTEGSRLSRQAVTKHLRVLERAGIVHAVEAGRESLFEYDPEPVAELRGYLDLISAQWDEALARLKLFVE